MEFHIAMIELLMGILNAKVEELLEIREQEDLQQ